MKTAVILLAAGGSSRMGRPKQLLEYQGKKLIQVVIGHLQGFQSTEVIVVLGASADEIKPYCDDSFTTTIVNPDWESGMASSLKLGLTYAQQRNPDLERVLISLVDQPMVLHSDYHALLEFSSLNPDLVVGSFYNQVIGVPIVFPKKYFPSLMELTGDQGARSFVRTLALTEMLPVAMPQAALDWDRPEDVTT